MCDHFVLIASIEQWTVEKRCAAWLRVPVMRSALIPQAAQLGFRYHHAEGDTAVLFLWLRPETCKIHPFATHQVGVAGKQTMLKELY
jgi:Nudix hydrolase domain